MLKRTFSSCKAVLLLQCIVSSKTDKGPDTPAGSCSVRLNIIQSAEITKQSVLYRGRTQTWTKTKLEWCSYWVEVWQNCVLCLAQYVITQTIYLYASSLSVFRIPLLMGIGYPHRMLRRTPTSTDILRPFYHLCIL